MGRIPRLFPMPVAHAFQLRVGRNLEEALAGRREREVARDIGGGKGLKMAASQEGMRRKGVALRLLASGHRSSVWAGGEDFP